MASGREEFVLGEDISSLARAKTHKGTVVLSVRLSVEEFAEVDLMCREYGKTPSQIVREAIKSHLHGPRSYQQTITISFEGGSTLATGNPLVWASAASAENLTGKELVHA